MVSRNILKKPFFKLVKVSAALVNRNDINKKSKCP